MEYTSDVAQREQASVQTTDLLEANTTVGMVTDPMTSVLINATDPRGPKAVALAADAAQWLKCRTTDGRKAYGIPSSVPGRYYLVTRYTCDCYDARRHECKHQLAVRLHCEYVAEQRHGLRLVEQADDIFARFEQDDRPLPTPDLSRILGRSAPRYQTSHLVDNSRTCGELHPRSASKVCGLALNHTGEHVWVLRTERED